MYGEVSRASARRKNKGGCVMREGLVESLKPSEQIDWQDHKLRSVLLTTWTVVKWLTVGFFVISAWVIWLIISIAFSEVTEKGEM
jgi:uncharacterized membrane protein YukC